MVRARRQPEKNDGIRVGLYGRVSDKSQAEDDKVSLQEQFADMAADCEKKGRIIFDQYQDIGPGWSKNRPGFQRLLADCRQSKIDIILCWKADRLTRGMYPAAALLEVMDEYQITIEAVKENIDPKFFALLAAIGKIEIDNFKDRSAMGRRGAAKQGRVPNKLPYGFRRGEDGKAIIFEEEAEVIRRIFRMYVHEGLGATIIGAGLTAEGVPSAKSAKRWHQARVNYILGNPAYMGILKYGRAKHVATDGGKKVYPQPPESWIDVPVPPIVDRETWDRAQELKKERLSKSKRNTKVTYTLQHLAKCWECGRRLGCRSFWGSTHRRNGKEYTYTLTSPNRYYHCYGLYQRIRCREHPYIPAGKLEDLVWEEVKNILENPQLIVAGIEALDSEDDGFSPDEVARAEKEIKKIQEDDERAVRLYVTGRITEEELDREREFIRQRLEAVNQKLDDYRVRQAAGAYQRELSDTVTAWAEKVGQGLSALSEEQRKEILSLVVEDVVVGNDNKVNITLVIPFDESMSIASEVSTPKSTGWTPTAEIKPG